MFLAPILSSALCAAAISPAQSGCTNDDQYVGNQSCDTAHELGRYSNYRTGLVVFDQPNYYDYFKVEVRPGATVTFQAEFTHADGNIDLVLRDQNFSAGDGCGTNLAFATTPTDNETIVWTNTASFTETVVLQVDLVNGGACNEYNLFVFNDNCPGDDQFDVAGGNDSCATATALSAQAGLEGALTITDSSDDHYRFQLLPGESLDLTAYFEDFRADLDLVLFEEDGGSCGATLVSSTSTTNNESVAWTNNGPDAVYVIADVYWYASGDGSTCVPYDLGWAIMSGPCSDDAFEPNDSAAEATFMNAYPSTFQRDLTIVDGDDDWFWITDSSPLEVYVRLDFTHADGDIDMALYSANNLTSPVQTSTSTANFEELNMNTASGGYYLRVYRYGGVGSCNDYQLSVLAGTYGTDLGGTLCEGSVNITGWWSDLNVSGSDRISDNDVTLTAGSIPNNTFGYFLNGRSPGVVTPPGANGDVCIAGDGVGRFNRPGEILNSGSNGSLALTIDLTDIPRASGAVSANAGEAWMFQCWYRDGFSSNFSDAVVVWFR